MTIVSSVHLPMRIHENHRLFVEIHVAHYVKVNVSLD